MLFADQLTLDAPRRTQDGYLAVRARAARVGVYQYAGHEVDPENIHGLRDQAVVNVLRDDATVFDAKSVHSFIGKPVTDNHPSVPVGASNWRDHARGIVMGAMRDGEYLAFDLMLTDADAIKAVENGKRELSNGYSANLEYGEFKAADGTICQARQASVAGNHVAIVDKGRAGPSCAIKDSVALCDANDALLGNLTPPLEKPAMKIRIGDAEVDATNGEAVRIAVDALNVKLADGANALKAAQDKNVADAAAIVAKDAEIEDLKAKLADAAITPAKLADAAKAFADVQAKAKALGVTFAADADTAAIKKAVVDAKMGDKAKTYTVDQIDIAFDVLAKDAAPADPLRDALRDGVPALTNDAQKEDAAYQRMVDRLTGKKTA